MPISSQIPIIGYVANGVSTAFTFPFVILSADDLKVSVNNALVTTGLSITGVGDRDGGTVTFSAPPAASAPIILYREVSLERTTDYQENGDLLASVLDDDLDRLWAALQDQAVIGSQALRVPVGETVSPIPEASERALKALGFNALGQPIALPQYDASSLAIALQNATPSNDGAALVGADDGSGGSLFTTVAGFISRLMSSAGSALMGFIQAGTGAVQRTAQDKMREALSVKDFGTPGASALNTAVAALKVNSGGALESDGSAISAPTGVTVDGEMSKGATLDFGHAVLSNTSGVGFTAGSFANPADQRRMKLWVKDLNVNGPGKAVAGTTAFKVDETADVFTFGGWLRNAEKGLDLNGALLCDFHSLMIRDTGTAISANKSLRFAAPNHNNFYSLKVFDNDKAINYDGPGLAGVNWFGCEIEGNNLAGNSSDGVSVIKMTNAGRHNFIGCHLELNKGQYGVDYEGSANNSNLLVLGSQVINEADTELKMRKGRLTAIASYIASGTSTKNIDISAGATATLIDTEGNLSGDKSRVVSINYGRIFFGGNATKDEAPIFIDGPSYYLGIAQRFRSDSTLVQFDKADGSRLGYVSAIAGAYMSMLGDGVPARIGLTSSAALFVVGRGGLNVAESATDNTMSLGTPSFKFKEVHTTTARTHALTVATLPAAAAAGAGARAFVTDANATTFASVVAGGGANAVPVYSDGTNWRIG